MSDAQKVMVDLVLAMPHTEHALWSRHPRVKVQEPARPRREHHHAAGLDCGRHTRKEAPCRHTAGPPRARVPAGRFFSRRTRRGGGRSCDESNEQRQKGSDAPTSPPKQACVVRRGCTSRSEVWKGYGREKCACVVPRNKVAKKEGVGGSLFSYLSQHVT